jgi:hypothetical protein
VPDAWRYGVGEDQRVTPPDDVAAFGRAVSDVLHAVLGDDLVGTYFVGSIALGGYVSGQSDLDLVAVCARPLDHDTKAVLVERLLDTTVDCPARGLELTLYRAEVASSPAKDADFEVNVNGGPRMDRDVHLSSQAEPRFWYVLDRAVAHRHAIAISGPPAAEVFGDVPRSLLLEVMAESMRWHREHERATLYSVLNAARAWRFAEDDVLGSKLEGAAWARRRWPDPSLIDAAVDLRHGRPGRLDEEQVDRLLVHVEDTLRR